MDIEEKYLTKNNTSTKYLSEGKKSELIDDVIMLLNSLNEIALDFSQKALKDRILANINSIRR